MRGSPHRIESSRFLCLPGGRKGAQRGYWYISPLPVHYPTTPTTTPPATPATTPAATATTTTTTTHTTTTTGSPPGTMRTQRISISSTCLLLPSSPSPSSSAWRRTWGGFIVRVMMRMTVSPPRRPPSNSTPTIPRLHCFGIFRTTTVRCLVLPFA